VSTDAGEFESRVAAIVVRFTAQQGQPPLSSGELRQLTARLAQLMRERGLPTPIAAGASEGSDALTELECGQLVARVIEGMQQAWVAEMARQLVKACFYRELVVCRDSFREVTRAGACRRQELARARGRVSGSHCVDCPHWVGFPPQEHARYLAGEWRGDPAIFSAHRALFLPEDFRALRQWLRAAACAAHDGKDEGAAMTGG